MLVRLFLAALTCIHHATALQGHTDRLCSSAFAVPGTNASYDYVVIGGGTAGLTVATRLAQNGTFSVAVIESGGFYEQDNGNLSVVPELAESQAFLATTPDYPPQPLMDWGFVSSPQPNAGNRSIHYAQGRTLGGSSAINTMAYHRGTVGAYQMWADAVGDQSYTWDNILPYFKKSSNVTAPNEADRATPNATVLWDPTAFDDSLGGPLQVSWGKWVDPTATWLAKALVNIGIPESLVNFNSGKLVGQGAWISTTVDPKHTTRSSSQTAYLHEALKTTQLMVYPHTTASRILFDPAASANSSSLPRASGVTVQTAGVNYTISVKHEVILSGGLYNSPRLLLLSGVGQKAVLEPLGIDVVSDVAGVGQNLWDQLYFGISAPVNTPTGAELLAAPESEQVALSSYLNNGTGPYSTPGAYIAFEKIPSAYRQNFTNSTSSALDEFPADWPEVEYVAATSADMNGSALAVFSAVLAAPLSRGNITINSSDPSVPPVINLGWFSNPADVQVAIAAFKRMRQGYATIPQILAGPELAPGPAVQTDAQIEEYIRSSAIQIWHGSATCKMGAANDTMAVLDSHARVRGVAGLRVVDISAFPFALPGHPQSSVYMLAEKIAADIVSGQ